MSKEKMFEVAIRNKYRFNFRGLLSIEDLYDLSVEDLDTIFKSLNSQIKQVKEESLLGTKSKQDKELELKIEIVKYIVQTKLNEAEFKMKAKENSLQKQRILEIMAIKQDSALENKSLEELEVMLNELK